MRPLISSSSAVKDYYLKELNENLYYCSYIKVEYVRGFIIPAIDFYFTLRMPNILSISDALSLWSNKFQNREIKAVLSMFSGLLENHRFNFNDFKDKERSSQRVADYIRRIMSIVPNKFKDIGNENSLCPKSSLSIDFNPESLDKAFRDYLNTYRSKSHNDCNLHLFLKKNQSKINEIIDNENIRIKNSNSDGFKEIVAALKLDLKNSCSNCSRIGDAIIALISPNDMRLEHTDYSFDFLMMILDKNHKRHPAESIIIRK